MKKYAFNRMNINEIKNILKFIQKNVGVKKLICTFAPRKQMVNDLKFFKKW